MVLVGGAIAQRAARLVDPSDPIEVIPPPPKFVSRGGDKLAAALDRFSIDPTGRRALDAGSSTGGFTDCLLQRGATHVTAVDVGRAQLHERLRSDPRVTVRERVNIRHASEQLDPEAPFDIVVADLSFISLRTVAAPLVAWTSPDGDLVALVKPQFEAGRVEASRGRGVVRDPEVWRTVLEKTIGAFQAAGATMMGLMVSPLRGADGNVEFLIHLRPLEQPTPDAVVASAIDAAVESARTG